MFNNIEVTVQPSPRVNVVIDKGRDLEVSIGKVIDWGIISNKPVVIINEIPNGNIDGVNKIFTVSNNFLNSYIWIYLNGLKLNHLDYQLSNQNTITLNDAPFDGDILIVDYLK